MKTCGPCSACCVALDVGALDKPAGVRCIHLKPGGCDGCSVYATRPEACRAFACGWLADASWRDDERPDVLGVLVTFAAPSDLSRATGVLPLLAFELRPGALDSPAAERLLTRLGRHRLVGLMRHGWEDGDRDPAGFVGPPALLAAVRRYEEATP